MSDFDSLDTVQNPLNAVSETALGSNTAQTAYDISWLGNNGVFNLDVVHHVDTFQVNAHSQGFFFITPDVDLAMTMQGSLDYSSVPGDRAAIRFDFEVDHSTDPFITLFDSELRGGNLFLEPASGTLAFDDEIVLPAGITWRIDYRIVSDNLSELSPAGPIDTHGFIHFEFSPVPEPSTLTLAGLGICLLRRHRGWQRLPSASQTT